MIRLRRITCLSRLIRLPKTDTSFRYISEAHGINSVFKRITWLNSSSIDSSVSTSLRRADTLAA